MHSLIAAPKALLRDGPFGKRDAPLARDRPPSRSIPRGAGRRRLPAQETIGV